MTINNPAAYCANLWDWGILRGCFGHTAIEPTDIDGFVERKGHFLLFETKTLGTPIKYGQWKTFNELQKTGLFAILIIWGVANVPNKIEFWIFDAKLSFDPASLQTLRDLVSLWYTWADWCHA